MSRSRSTSISDVKPPSVVNGDSQLQMPQLGFRQRFSAHVLGVKGSFLRQTHSKDKDSKEEGPFARLKLVLVCAWASCLINFNLTHRPYIDYFVLDPSHPKSVHYSHSELRPRSSPGTSIPPEQSWTCSERP